MLYIMLFALLLVGCKQEDDAKFVTDLSQVSVKFEPIAGGALVRYTLPKSDDILAINVRYIDAQGLEVMRTGSYLTDTMTLIGFTEARTDVEARITIANRDYVESDVIVDKFSTIKSGTVAFFDELQVNPHWDGFMIQYNGLADTRGLAHVYYVGTHFETGDPDTILLETFPIAEGVNSKYYELDRGGKRNDVIITTQDNRGYIAKSVTKSDVESLSSMKLESEYFSFSSSKNVIINDEDYYKVGQAYLFDGDTKGEKNVGNESIYEYYTFIAGPNAFASLTDPNDVNSNYFLIDMKEKKQPASIRIHSMLDVRNFVWFDRDEGEAKLTRIWGEMYQTLLPCNIKVFGTNDLTQPLEDWYELGEAEQLPDTELGYRWSYASAENGSAAYTINNLVELNSADELYLPIEFDAVREDGGEVEFRYLRIEIYDTFDFWSSHYEFVDRNGDGGKYITFNELELFVKD